MSYVYVFLSDAESTRLYMPVKVFRMHGTRAYAKYKTINLKNEYNIQKKKISF